MSTAPIVERTHHEFSPSKLNYLAACPGFRSKGGSSEAAEEGTMLHDICQNIVESWVRNPAVSLEQRIEVQLRETPLKEEQKESVRQALAPISDSLQKWATEVYTEEKVAVYYPDGTPMTFGYLDVVLFGPASDGSLWATIYDFKFGRKLVEPATTNLQGYAYWAAIIQARPEVSGARVTFIQPRAGGENSSVFFRGSLPIIYGKLESTIRIANEPTAKRSPGSQCEYCSMAGSCSALVAKSELIAQSYYQLPAVQTFHGSQISNPRDMALALMYVKQAEPAIKSVKEHALKMAKEGYELKADYNGQEVRFELKDKAEARVLGSAPLIYQAVKDVMEFELFTGCVDVRLGDLEKYYAQARVEKAVKTGEKTKDGKKFTKKAAMIELHEILQDAELISASDTRISYLKQSKDNTTQEENTTIDV